MTYLRNLTYPRMMLGTPTNSTVSMIPDNQKGVTVTAMEGLGRVRGRRMADRPTTPPRFPVVRRRLDAPAVIGGERR